MTDCYTAALRILRYRFNSEVELRRKLRAKKFEKEEIDLAVARLHREQWLDDARFAGAFVRTRANKRVGRLRIRRELQAAGVGDDEAAKALRDNVDAEREGEALRELCARRARILVRRHGEDYLGTEEGRTKLAAYLGAKGYDSALVWEVVREISRTQDGLQPT
ncbi:MAG TPA: RecX family transcriptional regulator [Thermoanaerobaculia bacterium]|nr:RecX family transcriptional regulator [Thermoanaerobaculia bacterium]